MSLPEGFIENMRALLGDELGAFLASLEEEPALALRANPLRPFAAAEFVEAPVPWAEGGFYFRSGARPGASVAHHSGGFYVQEASAMMPASVLCVRPGERVLDLCAAPGGKSTQLAAALAGAGVLVANEPDLKRARMLYGNIERMGVPNAVVVSELPERLSARWPGLFNAVLVDAPCSGEGMFRREPAARSEWSDNAPAGCAKRQAAILREAAKMVAPGGRLVYSTCTFNQIENEGVARAFLAEHPNFAPCDFSLPGLGASADGMLRVWPHRARGDGQFAALFVKAGEAVRTDAASRDDSTRFFAGHPPFVNAGEGARADAASRDVSTRFFAEHPPFVNAGEAVRADAASRGDSAARAAETRFLAEYPSFPPGGFPAIWGDILYAIPMLAPPVEGLRVISPGLALARLFPARLEPMHALAMASTNLPAAPLDERAAHAFLRGEAVPCDGAGWRVATLLGMPLGWGKASGGLLKNHLPKGLRKARCV